MNRTEFMRTLEQNLSRLPKDEKESALRYYEEFFDDAESEATAINELGDPKKVAKQILRENGIDPLHTTGGFVYSAMTPEQKAAVDAENKRKSNTTILVIIILLLTCPFWIGILGGIFGVLVGIAAVIFALNVTTACVGVAGVIGGIAMMFVAFPVGLLMLGVGLVSLGVMTLLCVPLIRLFCKFIIWAFRGITGWLSRLINGKEATAV